jgi:hypothetical protein
VVLVSLHFGWDLLEVEIPQRKKHGIDRYRDVRLL